MNVEYKIRPVVRYSVTRYHSESSDGGKGSAGCETLGVYDNERLAERALNAFQAEEENETSGHVVWRDSIGELATDLYYATSRAEALELQEKMHRETEHTWRIARRLPGA